MSIWFLYQKKKEFLVPTNDDWNLRRLFCFIIQIFRASSSRECENHICMITEKCINVGEKFIEFLSVEARICFICMHRAQNMPLCISFMLSLSNWMDICATSKLIGRWILKRKCYEPQNYVNRNILSLILSHSPQNLQDHPTISKFLAFCGLN